MALTDLEPNRDVLRLPGNYYITIPLNTQVFRAEKFQETADFRLDDPWSLGMLATLRQERTNLEQICNEPAVAGLLELGVGDARNLIFANRLGVEPHGGIIGVDIEAHKIALAHTNINRQLQLRRIPKSLHISDAVKFLQHRSDFDEKFLGAVIMCLPQAPLGQALSENARASADNYDNTNPVLKQYGNRIVDAFTIDEYGLTLNAATLALLRPVVEKGTQAIVALSHRVPRNAREFIINSVGDGETGQSWKILRRYKTEPITQDPGTSITYVKEFDPGERFFRVNEDNNFIPISAVEAERRRVTTIETAKKELGITCRFEECTLNDKAAIKTFARSILNVHHSVGYYILEAV